MKKILPFCALLFFIGCTKDSIDAPHTPFVYTDSVADVDGNYYHVVTIGTQVWMAENLRTIHFQNGDTVDYFAASATWGYLTTPAYAYYDHSTDAQRIYGNLYNSYAANDPRNICPIGWHIPTQAEWMILLNTIGGSSEKIREYGAKHWYPPNDNATDEFGFAALPGGFRPDAGDFENVRHRAYFWSSTYYTGSAPGYPEGFTMNLSNDLDSAAYLPTGEVTHTSYVTGCSIRCIKD